MVIIKQRFVFDLIVLLSWMGASQLKAQIFPTGSRICFVGNSITNNGEFHHNILLYHLTRFPTVKITVFNCGISGDRTGGIIDRLEDDILVHKPTHVVIKIGMNDVPGNLYREYVVQDKDTLQRRVSAIQLYQKNLDTIISTLTQLGITVILQTPSIYDQTAKLSSKNQFGKNDALRECCDIVKGMARKYNLLVVDYWTIMNEINQQLQAKDSTATLTSNDRVHPQSTGHFVMAYQFLKTTNAPKYVSKIWVTTKGKTDSAKNCSISSFKMKKGILSFKVKENALPFPIFSKQAQGATLVPFIDSLNVQLLQIPNISSGNYVITIDDSLVGNFTENELKKGINLALYTNTPQYNQAILVRESLTELWKNESNLRGIKFIEYNSDFKNCKDKSNPEAIKAYLEPIFKKKDNGAFFIKQLNNYITNKPLAKKHISVSDELRKKIFELVQPTNHIVKLVKSL